MTNSNELRNAANCKTQQPEQHRDPQARPLNHAMIDAFDFSYSNKIDQSDIMNESKIYLRKQLLGKQRKLTDSPDRASEKKRRPKCSLEKAISSKEGHHLPGAGQGHPLAATLGVHRSSFDIVDINITKEQTGYQKHDSITFDDDQRVEPERKQKEVC